MVAETLSEVEAAEASYLLASELKEILLSTDKYLFCIV